MGTFTYSRVYIFFSPSHDSGGELWFHVGRPCVCLSVHPSVSRTYVRRPPVHPTVCLLFPDGDLSERQLTFSKLGMCIDIVEIWFVIAYGQFSSMFDRVTHDTIVAGYYSLTFYLQWRQLLRYPSGPHRGGEGRGGGGNKSLKFLCYLFPKISLFLCSLKF